HRREAGREQELVLLRQRQPESAAERQHHAAAGLGAAGFEETEMPLRDAGRKGRFQLGLAGAPAIGAEGLSEGWDGGLRDLVMKRHWLLSTEGPAVRRPAPR